MGWRTHILVLMVGGDPLICPRRVSLILSDEWNAESVAACSGLQSCKIAPRSTFLLFWRLGISEFWRQAGELWLDMDRSAPCPGHARLLLAADGNTGCVAARSGTENWKITPRSTISGLGISEFWRQAGGLWLDMDRSPLGSGHVRLLLAAEGNAKRIAARSGTENQKINLMIHNFGDPRFHVVWRDTKRWRISGSILAFVRMHPKANWFKYEDDRPSEPFSAFHTPPTSGPGTGIWVAMGSGPNGLTSGSCTG